MIPFLMGVQISVSFKATTNRTMPRVEQQLHPSGFSVALVLPVTHCVYYNISARLTASYVSAHISLRGNELSKWVSGNERFSSFAVHLLILYTS